MSNKYLKLRLSSPAKVWAGEATTAGAEYLCSSGPAGAENGQESQGLDLQQISPLWRRQRRRSKFPLPACVSTQGKSVVLPLSDVGAGKAFTCSPWFSARQGSSADEVTLTAPGGAVQSRLPAILCTSLLSAGAGEDYFTIWKAKQICFNLIQCWSQHWFKLEDSLGFSVHWGKTYLDEEESFRASQGRIIPLISDACQNALPGFIDEGDKLI